MNTTELKIAGKHEIDRVYAIWRSITSGKEIIHVFGDSHASVFSNYKTFLTYPVGSGTAYNLVNENSSTKAGKNILKALKRIPKSETLIFIFGEIDCRIHVYKQYREKSKKIKMENIIRRIIERYDSFIGSVKNEGHENIIVSSVPPTSIQKNKYGYKYYAPQKTRIWITKEFNRQLKRYCQANKIAFLDMHTEFETKEGIAKEEFRLDTTHLNKKILLQIERQLGKLL